MNERFSLSFAGIVERDNNTLLVRANDGWGLPSGHVESHELLSPYSALLCEMAEETGLTPVEEATTLWGFMAVASQTKLSLGLIYTIGEYIGQLRSWGDNEVLELNFIDRKEIQTLLDEKRIRKPQWNMPILRAWMQKRKSLFLLQKDR